MTATPLASTRPLPSHLIDAWGWLLLSWAGIAVFAAALAALAFHGRWHELTMAAAFFVPLLVIQLSPHGLPNLLVVIITACFLVSAAGWAWDWYRVVWWFDVALHAINPLVMMAASMFMLWKAEFLAHAPRKGRFVLWSTGLGLLLGLGWEGVEVTFLDLTWPDTLLDLVMDGAGSALGGSFAIWLIERRGRPAIGRRGRSRLAWWAEPVPIPLRRGPHS
ncbi:hypothetical protein [Rubellimicrobium aerolatum]|uniref:VanZ family protein n=1 Tax=Rubellimicrobium aerolatum TaxID=490979 RepID=A0ABW0SH43_9RHOB|nr:hypothetical protein [Rubellimicrobium aerolatum]MBP1807583.1 hypothetical protein [Rubellimicrobium aerolatum]